MMQSLSGQRVISQHSTPSKAHYSKHLSFTIPDPSKHYIMYKDAADDACGAQLSQEYDGQEFPVAFLSHTRNPWHLLCCDKMKLLPTGI